MKKITRAQYDLLRTLSKDGMRTDSTWGGGDIRDDAGDYHGVAFAPSVNALHKRGLVDRRVERLGPMRFRTIHTINAAGRAYLETHR